MEKEEGGDLWLFTSEGDIREALEAAEQVPRERTVEFVRL